MGKARQALESELEENSRLNRRGSTSRRMKRILRSVRNSHESLVDLGTEVYSETTP